MDNRKVDMKEMTMEQFREVIREQLQERVGTDYMLINQDVDKTNGITFYSIMVARRNGSIGINLYLNQWKNRFENGFSVEKIVEELMNQIQENLPEEEVGLSIARYVFSYWQVQRDIRCKLVNTEKNRKLLAQVPSIPFLDLSLIFYINLETKEGMASVTISNSLMNHLSVTPEQLLKDALMYSEKAVLLRIQDVVSEMLSDEECEEVFSDGDPQMYVLSNTCRIWGASSILQMDILQELAEKEDSDLLILPSSIHETILLSANGMEIERAAKLVFEVNREQVEREEQLSNSVYLYDRENRKIILAFQGSEL